MKTEVATKLVSAIKKLTALMYSQGVGIDPTTKAEVDAAVNEYNSAKIKEDQRAESQSKRTKKVEKQGSCWNCMRRTECWGVKEDYKYPQNETCIRFKSKEYKVDGNLFQ